METGTRQQVFCLTADTKDLHISALPVPSPLHPPLHPSLCTSPLHSLSGSPALGLPVKLQNDNNACHLLPPPLKGLPRWQCVPISQGRT